MRSEALIKVHFPDKESAAAASAAISSEQFKKRVTPKVIVRGSSIFVDLDAKDIVALRAALNSYLRLLQAIEKTNL